MFPHKRTLQPRQHSARQIYWWRFITICSVLSILSIFNCHNRLSWFASPGLEERTYEELENYCSSIPPIASSEFHERQNKLAEFLADSNSVYIAEPGANAQYFGNISKNEWYLSERPLLLVISATADRKPNLTILTPSFEATRARGLTIPAESPVSYIQWEEDANPYQVAISGVPKGSRNIYLDDQIRLFIAAGLRRTSGAADVQSAPPQLTQLRETKSKSEIAILSCANEATLLAIRAVRKRMKIGIRASQVQVMLGQALRTAGLVAGQNAGIVLFGSDAALPHGGLIDRALGRNELVLIDVGGTLHGYHSDITRTFALSESEIETVDLVAWFEIQAAQRAAFVAAKNGTVASAVDAAARAVLEHARYGQYFTHRLGHGIGLETHETPYLRGSNDVIIKIGNTFSNEPGIYILDKVGIRLEDIFAIGKDGKPQYLTAGVGGPAESPWMP